MSRKKVMINGRAGAGKDVVADYLVKEKGYKQFAFADGIYDIAYNLFGMKEKERWLLIEIGQSMRDIDPDVWIKDTLRRIDELDPDVDVVVSDCRQSNEYEILIDQGFIPIRVNADEDIRLSRIKDRDGKVYKELLESAGEIGADNYFYHEVYNNTTLEDLYRQVDQILGL